MLRDIGTERDPRKKREVVRKVIALDTLGYDCSRLFGEMVIATYTTDIVVKKMAYQYLSHYARSNAELATLCINTMIKDCKDADPMVRGLAVRSLSALQLASTIEYLLPVLLQALQDPAPYVRRNGVLGVLKLFHLRPALVTEESLTGKVRALVHDRDAQVVMAAIQCLDEVLREHGGLQCDQALSVYLLNRIGDFNEWGTAAVLQLVSRYHPESTQEVFDIMNVLDPCLRQTNSAVVLGATKIFIRFAERMPDIKTAVYLRLKQPVLTLIASSADEIKYAVLCHAVLLVQQSPAVFEDAFKQFFLRHDDTMAVKRVKLSVLPDLANEDNVADIVNELAEYVSDINASLARLAIRAVGRIAVKTPHASDRVLQRLLEFLEMGASSDGVRSEAIVAIKDTLRKHPGRARDVLPALPRCLRRAEDIKGKAAAVWMLGEFGETIEAAPYLLERLVKQASELDVLVKMELLTALLKLFTKRAPEVHDMLVVLFKHLLADVSDTDLHDRAMFYYRLLRKDVYECARVMAAAPSALAEDDNMLLRDKLFDEFNTLSVLFNKPSEQFVADSHLYSRAPPPPPLLATAPSSSTATGTAGAPRPAAKAVVAEGNLLDGGDDIWSLIEDAPALDQAAFQANWKALAIVLQESRALARAPGSAADVEAALAARSVSVMASGDLGDKLKLFVYALDYDAEYFYAEVIVDKKQLQASCTVKSTAAKDAAAKFSRVVLGAL